MSKSNQATDSAPSDPPDAHRAGPFGPAKALYPVLLMAIGAMQTLAQSCPPDVISHNRAALVFIQAKVFNKETGAGKEERGTGFAVSSTGYLLTAYHLVKADEKTEMIEITGSLASRDAQSSRLNVIDHNNNDVALLKFADTSKNYPTLGIAKPSGVAAVEFGTQLCAMGFPLDKEFFFAPGVKSGEESGFWLTDMPSNLGDSGAPVFIASGEVVAIKRGGYQDAQNINLLIPLNLAQDLLGKVPDLTREGSNSVTKDIDRLTVSTQAGTSRMADFLKFLSAGPVAIIMDSDTAEELRRKNATVRTQELRDVTLRYVLEKVLIPQLPGPEKWTYKLEGKTVVIERSNR
jgi:S1-C subfamily serine protease